MYNNSMRRFDLEEDSKNKKEDEVEESRQEEPEEGTKDEGVEKSTNKDKTTKDRDWNEESSAKKGGLFSGLSFSYLLIIIVVVLVTTLIMNSGNNNGGTGNNTSEVQNTELSAGSAASDFDKMSVTYKGAYVVDGVEATIGSGTYESSEDDEVVFLVINGGSLVIDGDVTIKKTGSSDFDGRGDKYSFYGVNSAIVVVGDGSSATINGATIETSVAGANAVVATNGGAVGISDAKISTTKDSSRGLHATYGGTIEASGVTIDTKGQSCAALATDRGTGSVSATDMKLTTAGAGSPLIYSTGKITVSDSEGTATGAQIAVVEGKNSIELEDCEFKANGNGNRGSVDNAGVMIYQSMSGDASEGTGVFTADDCDFEILSDSDVYDETPFFFVTNTEAKIKLSDTKISFSDSKELILAQGTSEWGRSGQNGGKVTVSLSNVTATNTMVEEDSISDVSKE